MRAGEFKEGEKTLRAKIDLASPNMNMRDPAIYRIKYETHHRQGDKWCIYPMYDFAHPIQDAIEGITHSMCSLEFENHRPLYEWVITNIFGTEFPKQREFARLNMTNTVMSKRYLRELVELGIVDGWDDPRMPTLCGLRRRGYTPSSIFTFVREAGIAKCDNPSAASWIWLPSAVWRCSTRSSWLWTTTPPTRPRLSPCPTTPTGTPTMIPPVRWCSAGRSGLRRRTSPASQVQAADHRRRSPSDGRLYCQVHRRGQGCRGEDHRHPL